MRRVGDWMRLSLGDQVVDTGDPRHVGRLDHIHWGYDATVTWDNGYVSQIPLHCLERLDRFERRNAR